MATDLVKGVLLGLALGTAKLVWKLKHLAITVTNAEHGKHGELRLSGATTFFGLPALNRALASIASDCEIHVQLEQLTYIDHACLDALANFEKQHQAGGGRVVVDWRELERKQHRWPAQIAQVA